MRLACVRHAASVHSEPGSNSPVIPKNCFGPTRYSLFSFQRTDSPCSRECQSITLPMLRQGLLSEPLQETAFLNLPLPSVKNFFPSPTAVSFSRSEGAFLHTLSSSVKHLFYFFPAARPPPYSKALPALQSSPSTPTPATCQTLFAQLAFRSRSSFGRSHCSLQNDASTGHHCTTVSVPPGTDLKHLTQWPGRYSRKRGTSRLQAASPSGHLG